MSGGDGATSEAVSCMACGRLLRDAESRRVRLGPLCRRRVQAALAPRPRSRAIGTHTATPHPQAIPLRETQLAFEVWDDDDQDDDEPGPGRRITDVPTGALL